MKSGLQTLLLNYIWLSLGKLELLGVTNIKLTITSLKQNSNAVISFFYEFEVNMTRADQNTGGALLKFSMKSAMHGTSRVSSAISVDKISPCSLTNGIVQWIRS